MNDRGIISLYISPMSKDENFIDAELLNSLIILNSSAELLTEMARKKIINMRIGLGEQVKFLIEHCIELKDYLSWKHIKKTSKQLLKLEEERFKNMIGA